MWVYTWEGWVVDNDEQKLYRRNVLLESENARLRAERDSAIKELSAVGRKWGESISVEDRLRAEVERLLAALKCLLSKFPEEKTDYSGVGRCAGCGALHWCRGNPGPKEKCKPHCVLQGAKRAIKQAEEE